MRSGAVMPSDHFRQVPEGLEKAVFSKLHSSFADTFTGRAKMPSYVKQAAHSPAALHRPHLQTAQFATSSHNLPQKWRQLHETAVPPESVLMPEIPSVAQSPFSS